MRIEDFAEHQRATLEALNGKHGNFVIAVERNGWFDVFHLADTSKSILICTCSSEAEVASRVEPLFQLMNVPLMG